VAVLRFERRLPSVAITALDRLEAPGLRCRAAEGRATDCLRGRLKERPHGGGATEDR
jgi:hypothetical protein